MEKRCCANCIYSCDSTSMAWSSFTPGFPCGPLYANHPDTPGQLREVRSGGICRNYRPKPAATEGDIKRIPLGDGQYALVDAADYEWLKRKREKSQRQKCDGSRPDTGLQNTQAPAPQGQANDEEDESPRSEKAKAVGNVHQLPTVRVNEASSQRPITGRRPRFPPAPQNRDGFGLSSSGGASQRDGGTCACTICALYAALRKRVLFR